MKLFDADNLPSKKVLTSEAASAITNAALSAAAEKGIDYLVISVVDDGGNLITLSRQNGAEIAAIEIGIAKARTAAISRKPTQWWMDQLHNGVSAFLAMPGINPIGGAHPIQIDGKIVGAISASGGSFEVDDEICLSVLATIAEG